MKTKTTAKTSFKLGKKPNPSCSLKTGEEKEIINALFAPYPNAKKIDALLTKKEKSEPTFQLV